MSFSVQKPKVIEILKKIPSGSVTTYGFVGLLTGINPRVVGWILTGMSEVEMQKYPWQRVVAKGGVISSLKLGPKGLLQVELLRAEGWEIEDGQILNFLEWRGVDTVSDQLF